MPRYLEINKLPEIWTSHPKMNFRIFQKGELHLNRTVDFSTLLLVFKGTLSFLENGKRIDVNAGEYYIQEQNIRQEGVAITDPPVYFYIHFRGFFSDDMDNNLPVSGKIDSVEFRNLCNTAISAGVGNLQNFDAQLFLYRVLNRLKSYNSPKRGDDIGARVAEYIENNAANINTLDDVCREFNYNKDYIIRRFKKRFNITPYQYIKFQKINFAKELLKTTNLTISEIASNCNFSDDTVFFRTFKSVVGMSPKAFREQAEDNGGKR